MEMLSGILSIIKELKNIIVNLIIKMPKHIYQLAVKNVKVQDIMTE